MKSLRQFLTEELHDVIVKVGDLDVYKERNGNARPIYFAEYYQPENHFELA